MTPPSLPAIEVAGVDLDAWFSLHDDGSIEVRAGRVELGTGLRTALAQIVAEELDLPVTGVRIPDPDTVATPDEGYTAGSRSIRDGGRLLRALAAELRAVLLARGAERLGVPPEECRIADGRVVGSAATVRFGDLLRGGRIDAVATGRAAAKSPSEYRVVGTTAPRTDGPRKLTGGPAFAADVRVEGMLHARMIRPPRGGARLLEVDDAGLPTGARVVREGDLLAVVAEREADAVAAASRLRVVWSDDAQLAPEAGLFERMRAGPTEDVLLVGTGDVDAALADAPFSVAAAYEWPFQAHASIGPSAAVADATGDHVVVHAAAQGIHPLRRGLAALLGTPEEHVTVRHVEGSGCYGHNGADDVAADAALVSRAVGRPVRVQWSREDELVWARKGPAMLVDARGGIDHRGTLLALSSEVWTSTHGGRADRPERFIAGALRAGVAEPADARFLGGDRNARTEYAVASERVVMHWIRQPDLPSSSLRALGATANTFAAESLVDELAEAAGIDPLEVRLRNLEDPRAREVLERAADAAGWGRRLPDGTGLGMAFVRYENVGAYVATVAEVEVDADPGRLRVRRVVVAQDCGLVINPDGVRNQLEGNVIQSLSRSVLEQVHWDEHGIRSRDWETYPILRFSDVPEVVTILVDRPLEPALGVGEPATATTAPALANAIRAAGGPRVRRVPLAPGWAVRGA